MSDVHRGIYIVQYELKLEDRSQKSEEAGLNVLFNTSDSGLPASGLIFKNILQQKSEDIWHCFYIFISPINLL